MKLVGFLFWSHAAQGCRSCLQQGDKECGARGDIRTLAQTCYDFDSFSPSNKGFNSEKVSKMAF